MKLPATTIVKVALMVIVDVYPEVNVNVSALAVAVMVQAVLPNVPAPSKVTASLEVGVAWPVVPPVVRDQSVEL